MGDRIKRLVSSKPIDMVSLVSVIFETAATYSCYSKKVYFVKAEEKMFLRKLKVIAKGLDISGFGIV